MVRLEPGTLPKTPFDSGLHAALLNTLVTKAEKLAAFVAAKAAAAAGRADANSATEKYNAVLLAFCNAALLTDNDGSLGMIVVTGPAGTTGASYSGWKMAAI